MKKIVFLLLLPLVLVMGIGTDVYAHVTDDEMHIQVVPVTAVKSSTAGIYRREIDNQSSVINVYRGGTHATRLFKKKNPYGQAQTAG